MPKHLRVSLEIREQRILTGLVEANVGLIASFPVHQLRAVRGEYVASLRSMWILYVWVAAVGVWLASWSAKRPRARPIENQMAMCRSRCSPTSCKNEIDGSE